MNQRLILVGVISVVSYAMYMYYQNSEQHFDEAMHYRYASEYFIGDDRMHPRKPFLWVHSKSAKSLSTSASSTTTCLGGSCPNGK